jgi:FKBP-type peptidyl-prolyl cis-trans isomerase
MLQVAPPLDLRKAPADATKTATGLTYKKRFDTSGAQPLSGDTVLARYTGWRQQTGDTFFTTTGRAQPISIDLRHAAAGFREAVSVMHKGEKMMLWLPAGADAPEPIAYEIELVDIVAKAAGATTPVVSSGAAAEKPVVAEVGAKR